VVDAVAIALQKLDRYNSHNAANKGGEKKCDRNYLARLLKGD